MNFSFLGIASIDAATVSDGNNETTIVLTTKSRKALAKYFATLIKLDEDVVDDIKSSLVSVLASQGLELIKAVYTDGSDSAIKKVLGNKLYNKIKAEGVNLKNEIKHSLTDNKLKTAITNYEDLSKIYKQLENAVAMEQNSDELVRNFNKKANAIEKTLWGSTQSKLLTDAESNSNLNYKKVCS